MGKSAPQPPPAPNAQQVAQAQTASNEATALNQSILNNTNQQTPYGDVNYNLQPSGQWQETTTLSPAEQAIFNGQTSAEAGALNLANQQVGRVGSALGTPLSTPTLQTSYNPGGSLDYGYGSGGQIQYGYNPGGPIQTGVSPVGTNLGGEVGTEFGAQMQLLQPQLQQQSEQTQANLIAQGLNPNDAAYQNAETILGGQQATELGQVAANAVNLGNTEQNTLYGQNLSSGEFANSAQGQLNAENLAQAGFYNTAQGQANSQNQQLAAFNNITQAQANTENQNAASFANQAAQQNFQNTAYAQELPINELDALLGSGQVSMPTSTPAQTAVAPTDVTGAYALQSQAQQQDYQAQMANYQSGLGGLFNLGSAALMSFA